MSMETLAQIAARYETDKAEHASYLRNYEEHFSHLRGRDVRLLELGVKEGGSLLMWRDYFPDGTIAGLDIEPARFEDPTGRVRTYQGAQQDAALLDRIARECAPAGFDIVIDDCAHIGALARASFWHLFDNHLKPGGVYVVEDWGTGYWGDWVDGVRYRPGGAAFSPRLYRLTRIFARLSQHPLARSVAPASRLLESAKAAALRRQSHSHDYGMVGFVKELIDELGAGDATHPVHGRGPQRQSKFRELKMSPSHLFVFKA
jgi:SAM-dependent methyltransferase